MVKRLECKIKGLVQGVTFREFAERRARLLKLGGFVQNEPDARVRIVAEGDEEKLQDFLSHLFRGPVGGRIDDIETHWLEPKGEFRYFEIRY